MCGIVGAFRPQALRGGPPVAPDETIARMRDRMVHRGPDGAGLWRDRAGSVAFGHRRLSIIDLSDAAAQPMRSPDGRVTLCYNGEIYNHVEIRRELEELGHRDWSTDHSDTEVLLHAYLEWGLDCLQRFEGMFAFALHDARDPDRPLLHLVRDRVGVKPLALTKTSKGEWLFASELRALLAHPDVTAEMDPTAFWHYLTFIVAPAPLTMFRGIFKVPAGHGVTIDADGRARAWQYWDCHPGDLAPFTEAELPPEAAVEEFGRLLGRSIERRMVSDVPFGVLLSGGVDSSLNVALMSERMERPVQTFTIGYEGEEDSNEFRFARRVSEQYKTDHHEAWISRNDVQDFLPSLVRHQDEPIADNVCIPLYFLAKSVREGGCTVVQVGEGADETFLGYWWCQHYREKQALYDAARGGRFSIRGLRDRLLAPHRDASQEDAEIRARARAGQELFWGGAVCWWGALRDRLTSDLGPFRSSVDCPIEGLLPEGHGSLDSHRVVRHHLGGLPPDADVLTRIPYMEMKLRLPEHLLMRVDKLTMAHSVESRVPFLDHELVEFATRLPNGYKIRDVEGEPVGKWVVKRFAESKLPREIVHRKKQGFGAPMESWFADPGFNGRCRDALRRSPLSREGFFDTTYLESILDGYRSGAGGYSFHLWTVLNAVLWYESWIEGNEDCF